MGKTLRLAQGKTYAELCAEFPLRPIRSEQEYCCACATMQAMLATDSAEKTSDDADYMEVLQLLIGAYEVQYCAYVRGAAESDMNTLRILLGGPAMTTQELGEWLHSNISMPRERARRVSGATEPLTRMEIATLADVLHVSQLEFFVGDRSFIRPRIPVRAKCK